MNNIFFFNFWSNDLLWAASMTSKMNGLKFYYSFYLEKSIEILVDNLLIFLFFSPSYSELNNNFQINAILTTEERHYNPWFFTPFLKSKNGFLRSFFRKILTLCKVSIQERVIVVPVRYLKINSDAKWFI